MRAGHCVRSRLQERDEKVEGGVWPLMNTDKRRLLIKVLAALESAFICVYQRPRGPFLHPVKRRLRARLPAHKAGRVDFRGDVRLLPDLG